MKPKSRRKFATTKHCSVRKPGLVPSEQVEAEAFAQWLEINRFKFTHIPNETGSSDEAKRRAIRMKRAGTSPGFPDYLIYPPGANIAIELKSLVGKPSKKQLEWLEFLSGRGYACAICHGAREAIQFVEETIGRKKREEFNDHEVF